MKIIVDAMGGDNAPLEIVKGALRAKKELGVDLVLVGKEEAVREILSAEGQTDLSGIELVDARDVVTMEDERRPGLRRQHGRAAYGRDAHGQTHQRHSPGGAGSGTARRQERRYAH